MARTTSTRQITLRLSPALYEQIQQIARERHTSVNKLAQQELERLTRQQLEARLDAVYDALADDLDTDVEQFFPAQRETLGAESGQGTV